MEKYNHIVSSSWKVMSLRLPWPEICPPQASCGWSRLRGWPPRHSRPGRREQGLSSVVLSGQREILMDFSKYLRKVHLCSFLSIFRKKKLITILSLSHKMESSIKCNSNFPYYGDSTAAVQPAWSQSPALPVPLPLMKHLRYLVRPN